MSELNLIERLILEEISGKNQAIHSYDTLMWTVRTGFLTLFFAGWGILLKALLENPSTTSGALQNRVLLVMLFVSMALGIGGLVIDHNYARRKFRVIHALDKLISTVVQRSTQGPATSGDIEGLLQISGDKSDENYRKVSGYRNEAAVAWTVYLLPMAIATTAVFVLWK